MLQLKFNAKFSDSLNNIGDNNLEFSWTDTTASPSSTSKYYEVTQQELLKRSARPDFQISGRNTSQFRF
jgi:hypothetical protein